MELHIQSEFDCIYLINGEFFERADSVRMNEYDVVYVTVLPLKHTLLPYTVKLCGGQNITDELAQGIRLSPGHYLLALSPRHPIVYGTEQKGSAPNSTIARLFALLKSGDDTAAYAMLSDGLKADIDKATLVKFFSGYTKLTECSWESGNKFYLIDGNGAAHLHTYSIKDGFIDDITDESPD